MNGPLLPAPAGITAHGIRLRLGRRAILHGIDFQAQPGKITVLLGRNGSGKTSLLRCLAGTQTRYEGNVLLAGRNARRMPAAHRAQLVSLMPQALPRPAVTVRQLAAFGRQPWLGTGGRISTADNAALDDALARTGMACRAQDLVCHLSGGERQLAFFSMLLAQDTPIALLDEPTASLDTEYRRMVYRLLDGMRAAGRTVVVILHDLADAMELADHLAVLENGRLLFTGPPQAFLKSEFPKRAFGVRPVEVTDAAGRCYTLFRAGG